MEDALRERVETSSRGQSPVLILVLMEDALRGRHKCSTGVQQQRLNPCSNGRCSASKLLRH